MGFFNNMGVGIEVEKERILSEVREVVWSRYSNLQIDDNLLVWWITDPQIWDPGTYLSDGWVREPLRFYKKKLNAKQQIALNKLEGSGLGAYVWLYSHHTKEEKYAVIDVSSTSLDYAKQCVVGLDNWNF